MKIIDAVLFDLDGTLLDTAPDLANALNFVRLQENLPPLPFERIREVASDGTRGLLQLGFQCDETHAQFAERRDKLLTYYADHIADHTRLFDDIDNVLCLLEKQHIPWGIVTNKPQFLTHRLLSKLNLATRAACVVCGDTLAERKPHPAPLLYAAAQLNRAPSACCYIGDAMRDIEAAKSAGMISIAACYGYVGQHASPEDWQADIMVHASREIRFALEKYFC